MAVVREPEVIPPGRPGRGAGRGFGAEADAGAGSGAARHRLRERVGGAFRDENLDMLSHLLDDFVRVPGTNIRFGLDGVIALIPGVGDLLQGLASTIIIVAAWARGVPPVTLVRMVANVGIEVLVGMVPVLGDMFDIAWKANRRNYALLTGSLAAPVEVKRRSWWFFAGLCGVLLVLVLLPLVVFAWLTAHFLHGMLGHGRVF